MDIVSPTTSELHSRLLALQHELKQEPPANELEQFLNTKKGRRSKRAAEMGRLTEGVVTFGALGNMAWLGFGLFPFFAHLGLSVPGPDAVWMAGAIGAPILTQAGLMLGAGGIYKQGQGYREAQRSKQKRRSELNRQINETRHEMMTSAAEDLRQQRFSIISSDPSTHSFTTHQGVVSLMTDRSVLNSISSRTRHFNP